VWASFNFARGIIMSFISAKTTVGAFVGTKNPKQTIKESERN
jgi:hypothetical protein